MDTTERSIDVSRRGFLAGTAGLTFALTLPAGLLARPHETLAADAAEKTIGAWARIATDGAITLHIPAAEMGQGAMTGLAMVFAEEMDADWSRVTAEYPPIVPSIFGNPRFGGMMVTFGSGSTRGYWDKIRPQAAAVRRVLMQAAADKWGVPLAEVHTEASVVVHGGSGRRLSYGEIAAFAKVPDPMPTIDASELKKLADYRILGKDTPRPDIPPKTTGAAQYSIDVRLPDMVYATVLRTPVEGGAPEQVDDKETLAVPGVLKVVPMTESVGIVGESVEAVFAGREALKVKWSKAPADNYRSDTGLKEFMAKAAKLDEKGVDFAIATAGDVDGAFARAAKVISAQYSSDYVYHAQMEPMNVIAAVTPDGGAEIWIGSQGASLATGFTANFLKTTPDKIKFHQYFLGGGYGRRSPPDMMADVLTLAKEMQRPVKLIWTREQDVKAAKMRPMTGHYLQAALDASGNVIGWRHRVVGESVVAYRGGERALEGNKGLDNIVMEGATHEYEVPNRSVQYVRENRGVGLAAWRGIGAGYNKFVIESFIEELAAERKIDPVEFRLGLLKSHPRPTAVIKAVVERSGWGKPVAEGHALGFCYCEVVETYVAAVGEISVDRQTGVIRAHKFWVALDPGIVINPDSIMAQTEGNIIFGLSQTLKEQISVSGGAVDQNNFYDYPVLRMSEMPEIDVQIIATDNPPKGIGEAALPVVGPCVANALFTLTGKRLRALPLMPERVKAGLATA